MKKRIQNNDRDTKMKDNDNNNNNVNDTINTFITSNKDMDTII